MDNHFMNKDESIETERLEKEMTDMSPEKKEDILDNFNRFKMYLKSKVEMGEKMGMDEHQIATAAEKVANYLARNEEPQNREQMLLKELWMIAQKDERHTLAHLLVRMCDRGEGHSH